MKSTKEPKNKIIANTVNKDQSMNEPTEFPGYPLYDPEEDIMNQAKRVELNLDEGASAEKINDEFVRNARKTGMDEPVIDNRSELTKEDMEALGPKDLSLDMGEDEELLKHRVHPVDFTAKDLDIPGSELDDAKEAIGGEDEENNSYSLGGDAHDNLEEDKS